VDIPITPNPTDTRRAAVALQYEAATDDAPKVIAKGRGLVAEKIMALAREHGIPMREDPDLVQMLTQIDLDHAIPPSLYKVVAELLAFVYRLNQSYQRSGSV
jgi:flagellar biosynthesis protein